jgi:aerobic C4-dicarboxylate transport protein
VLIAVVLGIGIGALSPDLGKSMKPLGDGFIKLVKMMIAPIIFCTVVHGVASMNDLRKLGRVGIKTLVYFEVVSTFALVIGLIVVNLLKPGAGFNIDPASLDPEIGRGYAQKAHSMDLVSFFLNIIPDTLFSAFVSGDLLQVLVVSGLTAFAVTFLGDRREPVLKAIDHASEIFFGIMRIVVKLAPLGALGAMAFTVGSYGLGALNRLAALMAGFYVTSGLFVFVVLGPIAAASGFSLVRFLAYIKEELLLVLGTSSSETALPGMIRKMRRLGCADSTVGLVIPTGYSFNLDGTNIYMAMAAVFLAQATNTPLDLRDQLTLLLVAMVSSKGASGVTGAGFVTLAATLAVVPKVPVASLALLVGIDRFMSECRAITNLI